VGKIYVLLGEFMENFEKIKGDFLGVFAGIQHNIT